MSTSKIWNLRWHLKKPLGINNLRCLHEFLNYWFIKAFIVNNKFDQKSNIVTFSIFNAMRQFSSLKYLCTFPLHEVEQLANSYLFRKKII